MKNLFISLICFLLIACTDSGTYEKPFNLDFEIVNSKALPDKWDFPTYRDYYSYSLIKERGRKGQVLEIQSNGFKQQFAIFENVLYLEEFPGKKILFTGSVRTDSVNSGYAGIWMRIDSYNQTVQLDNMNDRGITGTSGWQEVSIEMEIAPEATHIVFGGILTGEGTAWFDDLEITIDGEKLEDRKVRYEESSKKELAWLRQYVHPLDSWDAESPSGDLKVLDAMIGDAPVVALGECTHGTAEIFKMKHRLVKYLREKHGFDIFSIEANMPESYKVSDYTLRG